MDSAANQRGAADGRARRVRVGLVQMPSVEDRETNVERAVAGIREAV